MFSFSKLTIGLAAALILACFFIVISAGADSDSGWLAPTSLYLDKVADEPSIPAATGNNIDCYFDRGGICSHMTPYGLADTTGFVKLNHNPRYAPVTGHIDERRHFFAIPGSNSVMTYTTDPVYGAYVYFNHDFLSSIELVQDPAGFYYHMLKPPDAALADRDGHKLPVDLPSASFSQNSEWMVISEPNNAMLRVNLRTFEVLPFAPGFRYDIGLSPQPVTAITNDGRYAVFASKDFNRFAVYDLSTCGAVPSTIIGPVSCQSRDLQTYMNSQLNGFIVPSGLRFVSNGRLSFYTTYNAGGTAKTAKFTLATNAGPIHQQDYLALGDSYISGEGAFKYLPGTDTGDNQCHVSGVSYPLLIGGQLNYNSFHSVACSGATSNDIIDTSETYKGQAEPHNSRLILDKSSTVPEILSGFQQGYIDQLDFVQQYQPKNVTISIGGNDIGFANRLQACLGIGTCYSSYEDRLEFVREVNQTFPDLVSTYLKIKDAGADDAQIYVIGYPQIAKADGDCALNVHMNESELEFVQQAIDYLDTVIKSAAAKAGVYYVDTQDALNGHRLCEAGPGSVAMNGLTAGNDFPDWLGGPIGRESYHPNEFGYLLLENKVLAATHNLTASMTTADMAAAPPAETGQPILDAPRSGRTVNVTEYDNSLTSGSAYRGTAMDISIIGTDHALAAGTTLQAQLHSNPLNLGGFKTDSSGNLSAQIVVPGDVPAGYHTLHFYGADILGQPIDIYKTLYIAATADDTDGNDIADSSQTCVGIDSAGVDSDKDGIDDSCDGTIGLPPAQAEISAVLSSSTQTLLASAAPSDIESSSTTATLPSDQPAAPRAEVLAVRTAGPSAAHPSTMVAKNGLQIPARYYLAAGLGFLTLTGLSYFYKRG
jgi:lysophospholipase L1-like esterase